MNCLDSLQRKEMLLSLERQAFDLLIVGGGITGAGLFHEAGKAGLKAVLLEANDFAAGTSSRSTKLIHGGLRYLAMGQFNLVAETLEQRDELSRLAPHLAQPNWLMLPARNWLQLLKYRIGVSIYEWLGRVSKTLRHRLIDPLQLSTEEPLLNTELTPLACEYTEYLTDDARLVLANIRSGVASGGMAASRVKVEGFTKKHGKITGVRAVIQETGHEISVSSRMVVNATGPWVESIAELEGESTPKPLVLSKGIHLVVSRVRFPLNKMALLVADDKRPVFVIPRGAVVYIGTTDTLFPTGPDYWPEVKADDVAYLLKTVNHYYLSALGVNDVLTTWAGLRPLIYQSGKNTREISRRDEVWVSASGLVTIAGGKLTGYAKMARDTLSTACAVAGMSVPESAGESSQPLPGGDLDTEPEIWAARLADEYRLAYPKAERLVRLYGSEARDVLDLGKEPLGSSASLFRGEIVWAVRQEAAGTLEDVLYRRTRIAVFCPEEMKALLVPVADLMAQLLDWSRKRQETEILQLNQRLAQDLTFSD